MEIFDEFFVIKLVIKMDWGGMQTLLARTQPELPKMIQHHTH
jgi:hypothetical protein